VTVTSRHQCNVALDMLCTCVCFRLNRLLSEIMAEAENKTLIFAETKKRADELTMRMRREGLVYMCTLLYNSACIHCVQEKRDQNVFL